MSGAALGLDLSGVTLRLAGTDTLRERLRGDWSPFVVKLAAGDPLLDVRAAWDDGTDYDQPDYQPKSMQVRVDGATVRFEMPEGRGALDAEGRLSCRIVRAAGERAYWTLVNFIRAGLAWRLPERRALMLHAAGMVVDGTGYVLVGPADSGKSTWVRLGEAAGAHVVSDDLVVVAQGERGWELLGTPFRSTHRADYRPGRWPLAAVLVPAHGAPPRLADVPALIARARLVANLPFVSRAVGSGGALDRMIDGIEQVPHRQLTFDLDPGFVELLRPGQGAPGR